MVECGSVTAPGQWVEELGTRRRGESGRHGDPGAPGPSGAAGMRDPNSSTSDDAAHPEALLDGFDARMEELGTRRRRHGSARLGTARRARHDTRDPGTRGPSADARMRDPNSSISASGSRSAAFLDSFDPRLEELWTRRLRRGAATLARLGTARLGTARLGTARRRGPRYPGTARRPGHGAVRQAAQAMQVVAMGRASSRPGAIGAPHTRQTP